VGASLLGVGHLETGRSAPQTPSAGMDAAVVRTPAVRSNAPHSMVVASTPPFARLHEQTGCYPHLWEVFALLIRLHGLAINHKNLMLAE